MQLLTTAEQELYEAQPVVDRAHSVSCAIAARDDLVSPTDEAIVASALHDVGKAGARLGTFGRVLATIVPTRLHERWAGSGDGRRARLAHYAAHDRIGADLLREAGSADLVVAWAGEHHLPEDQWSLDPEVGRVLLAADG